MLPQHERHTGCGANWRKPDILNAAEDKCARPDVIGNVRRNIFLGRRVSDALLLAGEHLFDSVLSCGLWHGVMVGDE